MCAGSALREEYRRCLEREFRRGRAGACSDPSLAERLRQRLELEPALLGALQEDGPALLASGLRGRSDLGPALQGLAVAFQLLELAAVNLYLFPWRREFGTLQTFSGAYVHWLRPALPEADLLRSFGRLGYERRDPHRLTVSRLPPGPELVATACGFFACRLECEILGEVVRRLQPRHLHPEELLEARGLAGNVEACVEMLRHREAAGGGNNDGMDLYQEMPAGPEDTRREDIAAPVLWRDPGSPQGAQDVPRGGWDSCRDSRSGQEPVPPTSNPNLDTSSSSRLFLEEELGGASSSLSALALGSRRPQVLGEPQDLPPTAPQEAPELPCYQLHSCLRRGGLPSYCCTTCQQLHAGACAAGQACRSHHRGQELRSERQQRLWLQRTEVDMLLADGSSPRS
ncbi:PREDICTED: spermatogenesis-associated protein 2-like protein [Calidris pugnax]|uniref:spermatogenesis-associated protein 2-like protein n=1 Tax=Calidris pugnax TaxID=198806 RepID=UPI00071CDC9A|nr:PREDICTED: spermatogenesis-associated protein 2-like protein [Calidris pugnax]